MDIEVLSDLYTNKKIIITVSISLIYFLLRKYFYQKSFKADDRDYENKMEQRKRVLQIFNTLFYLAIFFVWITEVQDFFVSIFAVLAALVLATKELIMNATGGILLRISHSFRVRDRIEINKYRGYVLEKGLTHTKVLEIGPEKESQQTTGNIISIPNSIFLNNAVTNESYFKDYSIKSFNFHFPKGLDLELAESFLTNLADSILSSYVKKAQQAIGNFCRKEGIAIPVVGVRVKVLFSPEGKTNLLLKMPVQNNQIADVEQKLVRGYIKFIKENKA